MLNYQIPIASPMTLPSSPQDPTALTQIDAEFERLRHPDQAANLARFFKTGPGQYGEGDEFWGIKVPQTRKIAKQFKNLPFTDIAQLLQSQVHEKRLLGLLILVGQYQKADDRVRASIFDFYVNHLDRVNNWDLVDSSAAYIVGHYLFKKPIDVLLEWAKSANLWHRRVAIISTHYAIKQNEFNPCLTLSQCLLTDSHDLIHKAVGWMLREVGNRNMAVEIQFLDQFAAQMPRTMLRYAIEKFPESTRQRYLALRRPT